MSDFVVDSGKGRANPCPYCDDGCNICDYTGFKNPWQEQCPRCLGKGKLGYNLEPIEGGNLPYDWSTCGNCEGSGVSPTPEGEQLLNFLKTHLCLNSEIKIGYR